MWQDRLLYNRVHKVRFITGAWPYGLSQDRAGLVEEAAGDRRNSVYLRWEPGPAGRGLRHHDASMHVPRWARAFLDDLTSSSAAAIYPASSCSAKAAGPDVIRGPAPNHDYGF